MQRIGKVKRERITERVSDKVKIKTERGKMKEEK
jgi:hypothetical protein